MFAVYAKEANLENPLASLVVGERPDPVVPEGWVRVKMTHVSLNRHDVFTLRGLSAQEEPIPFPMILGNDGAGLLERAFDRSYNPVGVGRQMLAILASGSRVDLLKTIRAPTLVLHGEDDPLAPVEGGRDTARLTPGATLKIISGWGHDIPTALIPTLVEAIAAHCQNVERAAAASSPAARKDRATGVNGARNIPKYGAKLPVWRMAISRLRDRRRAGRTARRRCAR